MLHWLYFWAIDQQYKISGRYLFSFNPRKKVKKRAGEKHGRVLQHFNRIFCSIFDDGQHRCVA